MKKRIIISLFSGIALFALFVGAGNKPPEPKPTWLEFKIPQGWPKPATDIFAKNRLSEEGFQLGKKLFHDGRLSKDGNFPCASCHQQFGAFASYDHDLSHGYNNTFTTRNAPGLFNLAWMPKFHWDGGVNHIEVQPLSPITAPNEMAENLDSVLRKLRKDTAYPKLFKAAFGTTEINSQRMLKALAQFTGSIVSANSKYDKVQRGEATFTPGELNGYNFFKANCAACHKEPLFTDYSFRNNGLAASPYLKDQGRMKITGNKADSLKFKVPSLRNVMLTFPYMHDGRFYSLGAVIDHYRTGIITTQPTLDSLLIKRIAISNREKNELIYFLNTLTDTVMTRNPRFAEKTIYFSH
ncbi:MAG TPA: cytochrome c peroxidase [Ferruginibacter sp.]|nr:cytochrome c peroxidase [Ferruginibacter sp.]